MKTKSWAIVLIILCTVCTSFAAILNKKGATLLEMTIKGTILNYYLIGGLILLGIGAAFLMLSLKGGDVSVIYPVIATSYVWVTIMSYYFFDEVINSFKVYGIIFIVAGVIIVNLGQKKELLDWLGIKHGIDVAQISKTDEK